MLTIAGQLQFIQQHPTISFTTDQSADYSNDKNVTMTQSQRLNVPLCKKNWAETPQIFICTSIKDKTNNPSN